MVRHVLVATCLAAVAIALPVVPSYAAPVTLYVSQSGDDGNDCSAASPCLTISRAIFAAPADGTTTITVGAGTFDGPVRPGVLNKSVAIVGSSPDYTILTADDTSAPWYDGTVVDLYGTTDSTMSDLSILGGAYAAIDVQDVNASLALTNVHVGGAACGVYVSAGTLTATDSTVSDGAASGGCGTVPNAFLAGVFNDGGAVSLTRSQIVYPAANTVALVTRGGTTTLDQTFVDDSTNWTDTATSTGVLAKGGAVTIGRSTVSGFGTGVDVQGATVVLQDASLVGNTVGVSRASGSATVVRSSLQDYLAALQGSVSVAGSVVSTTAGNGFDVACNGPVTDLGYNVAADGTCGLTATGSKNSATTGLDPNGLDYLGGPVQTIALRNHGAAVDLIPVGATYADNVPLCPSSGATDLRGVPRPTGTGCEAGSMELAGTVTTLQVADRALAGAPTELKATVALADVGIDGIGDVEGAGAIVFKAGNQQLCDPEPVLITSAECLTVDLKVGTQPVTATFVPAGGTIVDQSTSAPHQVLVGTKPTIAGPGKVTVRVGRSTTISLRAKGQPAPSIALVRGRLPAGLKLSVTGTKATITGKPKASGVGKHALTFRAKNTFGKASHVLTIVVTR